LGYSVSHEAIRRWYLRLRVFTPRLRRFRTAVAVDETKVKVVGGEVYVWSARDVASREVLTTYVSYARSNLTADLFLRRVSERCLNRPLILVDRGPWYPYALEAQGFHYRHETFGERNAVEQWFSLLKHRTKRFYNNYPHNSSLKSAEKWMEAYAAIHNLLTLS